MFSLENLSAVTEWLNATYPQSARISFAPGFTEPWIIIDNSGQRDSYPMTEILVKEGANK